MLDWFRKLRRATRKLVLPSRDSNSTRSQNKLELSKFTPPIEESMARLSMHLDLVAASLSRCASLALSDDARIFLDEASARHFAASRILKMQSATGSFDPDEFLESRDVELMQYSIAVEGVDYYERLASLYVSFGIIQDFYVRLSDAYPRADASKLSQHLKTRDLENWIATELLNAMRFDLILRNRLALWTRSVVADCLLEIWRSLRIPKSSKLGLGSTGIRSDFREIEPLVTVLVESHSSRMGRLELTA